ncbi:MAG: hypothetical protein KatS3mg110_0667 [Pirellulaceae bacterium]|nr:MAG: hypothetical protein KatS3mg110_0667 [Pirellulaceae bacterium]
MPKKISFARRKTNAGSVLPLLVTDKTILLS